MSNDKDFDVVASESQVGDRYRGGTRRRFRVRISTVCLVLTIVLLPYGFLFVHFLPLFEVFGLKPPHAHYVAEAVTAGLLVTCFLTAILLGSLALGRRRTNVQYWIKATASLLIAMSYPTY